LGEGLIFNLVWLPSELQGHAIKNQDLLIASGAISLKGSDGMTAVEEDVAAVSNPSRSYLQQLLICV